MGLLSLMRELASGMGGTAEDKLMRQELEQVRLMAEVAEQAGGEAAEGIRKVRRRYHFVGSVQGVGFRWTTTNLASSAGATGWVRNEKDGSVTAEIQGTEAQVDAVFKGLDRYYNTNKWMQGFRVESVREVAQVAAEEDFEPRY